MAPQDGRGAERPDRVESVETMEDGEGNPSGPRRARLLLQVAASLVLLAGVVYAAGGLQMPAELHPGWAVAAGGAFLAAEVAATWAWAVYLGRDGAGASWWSMFRANQASHVASLLLPSPTPSLTRPVFLAEETVEQVLASTIVERVNVLLVYGGTLLLAALGLWWWTDLGAWAWLPALAGLSMVALSIWATTWLAGRPESRNGSSGWWARVLPSFGGLAEASLGLIDRVLATAGTMARDRGRVASGLLLQTVAILVLHGVLALSLALALDVQGPRWALFLLPTAAGALSILPGLPRGLGAVEGAGTLMLVGAGLAAGPALTFLVAHRVVTVLGILVLGGPAIVKTGLGALFRLRAGGERVGEAR